MWWLMGCSLLLVALVGFLLWVYSLLNTDH